MQHQTSSGRRGSVGLEPRRGGSRVQARRGVKRRDARVQSAHRGVRARAAGSSRGSRPRRLIRPRGVICPLERHHPDRSAARSHRRRWRRPGRLIRLRRPPAPHAAGTARSHQQKDGDQTHAPESGSCVPGICRDGRDHKTPPAAYLERPTGCNFPRNLNPTESFVLVLDPTSISSSPGCQSDRRERVQAPGRRKLACADAPQEICGGFVGGCPQPPAPHSARFICRKNARGASG